MVDVPLNDAVFLHTEGAGRPNHVIALQLFRPPADASTDYLAELHCKLLEFEVKPLFRKTVRKRLLSPTGLAWRDEEIDIDYHVRRAGLPAPGRVRELLEAVSLQHGVMLDRNRPLWECHLYEGLSDGRFALAFKAHHGLADGMSFAKHIFGGLADGPTSAWAPPWASKPGTQTRAKALRTATGIGLPNPFPAINATVNTVRAIGDMALDTRAVLPYRAPNSILNASITGARRFAGDKWAYARLKTVAESSGGTVNDVVLAMCGGALRDYLIDIESLPERSLVAMVPISLRRDDLDAAARGNSFGSILCDLRTDTTDPLERLGSIVESTRAAKDRMSALTRGEAMAVSQFVMAGVAVGAIAGITGTPRQPFNLIISNVPASTSPLYLDGAQMTDLYPISMISEGQAANITVTRYHDSMNIGVVGDRKRLPHLQRMLTHLENALVDLEKAA